MALTEKIVSRLRDNVSALPAQVGDVCSHALACIRAKWDLSTSATLTSILQDQLGAQVHDRCVCVLRVWLVAVVERLGFFVAVCRFSVCGATYSVGGRVICRT